MHTAAWANEQAQGCTRSSSRMDRNSWHASNSWSPASANIIFTQFVQQVLLRMQIKINIYLNMSYFINVFVYSWLFCILSFHDDVSGLLLRFCQINILIDKYHMSKTQILQTDKVSEATAWCNSHKGLFTLEIFILKFKPNFERKFVNKKFPVWKTVQ